jgi:predicted Fe-S protein YdhL (DUF1289 family)
MKFGGIRIDQYAWMQLDNSARRDVMRQLKRDYARAGYLVEIRVK